MTARPFVSLSLGGFLLDVVLGRGLMSFSYRDVHHGEVDDIEFRLADPKALWRGGLGPREGTTVTARVGYEGVLGAVADCGLYQVDQTGFEVSASGDTASYRGLSAFTSQDLRTARSEAYDEVDLSTIVNRVARRNGLRVVGDIPAVGFTRISQSKQGDLTFLLRLAEDWGCYCSAKGDVLVFTDRVAIDGQQPAHLFEVSTRGLMRCALERSSHRLFPRSELRYLETGTKRTIAATATDARIRSGDTLILDDKVETQAQADRLALARLLSANDGWTTGTLQVEGRPSLVAGQVIALGVSFGEYAGRYLVTGAQHDVDGSGYTTSADVRGL